LDLKWIWALLTAVGYGATAWLAVRRRWQRFTTELLLAYVALSTLWIWSKQLSSGAAVLRISLAYGLVVLSTLLGMLTSLFVHQNQKRAWLWAVDGGTILLIMAVLDLTGARWRAWSKLSTLGLSSSVAVIGWGLLSAVAFVVSWSVFRKTWRPLYRNRFRYWMLAIILLLFGAGLFILLDHPYSGFGVLLHMMGTAGAVVALLAHRLPDLSGVVRQLLRQIMLTVLTGVVFLLGIVAAQQAAQRIGGMLGVALGSVGVAAILALLFPVLRQGLSVMLNRLLFGEGYDPQRILQEYSQGISNILDLEVLAPAAVGIIREAMGVHHGTLVVCEGDSDHEGHRMRLRPVPGVGTLSLQPIVVDAHSPLLASMVETRAPVSQYDLDLLPRFQQVPDEQRRWFANLGAEVYVPIHAQDRLLGILALGAKVSSDPYTSADVALLRTLAGPTAVALENARLVDDLKQLNAEITQLNRELTKMNERLAILDKTKSDFISISSHELKTPLTQVKGYADILLEISRGEASVHEAVQQMAEGIVRGVKRLHGVVDAMLDVSLIEAEAFAVHAGLISLRYIVEQVIDSLEAPLIERRQTVISTGLSGLPNIVADGTRLYQALRNILINAIKFTPDDGSILVRARTIDEGAAVEIAITDSGVGIDSEHQELIFEKFYRVDDLNLHSTGQTKFKGAGPGLGLPIAKGIIEAHGGHIWVESSGHDEESLPGSTFYIVLPVNGQTADRAEISIQVSPNASPGF
jgi:signal transduction histidine kinase